METRKEGEKYEQRLCGIDVLKKQSGKIRWKEKKGYKRMRID